MRDRNLFVSRKEQLSACNVSDGSEAEEVQWYIDHRLQLSPEYPGQSRIFRSCPTLRKLSLRKLSRKSAYPSSFAKKTTKEV